MSTTSEELTPRAKAKRQQIRTAAQTLFLEHGFAEVSTNMIASAAGVSKETLYRYFSSKEALLTDCLAHLIADISKDGPFAAGGASPMINSRDDLRNALLGLAHKLVGSLMQPDYLALVRVIISETPRLPQLGDLFRKAVPESAFRSISVLLARAQEQGVVRAVDAEAAARMFVGPLLTYVLIDGLFVSASPARQPSPKKLEAVVDLYLQAITAS